MYQQPEKEPSGCAEVWVLTRAVFGILLGPLIALFVAIIWLVLTLYLFFASPPLALVPLGLGVLAFLLFARWERNRPRPPQM